MNILSPPIIAWNRTKHLIKERKYISTLENTIESIRIEYERAKKNEMPHFERIYNVGLYILLLEYDVSIIKNDALFSIRDWKKKFVARQLAVLLYEASHDIPELLGKDFRTSLKTLPLSSEDWDIFNSITKNINAFKNQHRSTLNELRNYVGAHRDKDAGRQLEIIETIDLLKIMELAAKFYSAKRELIPFLIKITIMMGNWKVLLKHMPAKVYEA